MPKISLRAAARAMNRARKHPSGGHQGRKPGAISRTKPRCPCGKMTLQRAQARGRSPEHRPGCQFYPLEDFGSPSRIRKSPRRMVGVARGPKAIPVTVGTRPPGGEPEGPAAVLPELPREAPIEATHQVLEPSVGPKASAPGGDVLAARPVTPATLPRETLLAVGGTPGAVSVASGSPPLGSAEVVEVYKEVQPYGGSQGFASQLVTACREKDPSCTPTQVAEVVRSHHADIRGAGDVFAWILGQVPRFFEGGYQRPGDARREILEGQIRLLRRLQK